MSGEPIHDPSLSQEEPAIAEETVPTNVVLVRLDGTRRYMDGCTPDLLEKQGAAIIFEQGCYLYRGNDREAGRGWVRIYREVPLYRMRDGQPGLSDVAAVVKVRGFVR